MEIDGRGCKNFVSEVSLQTLFPNSTDGSDTVISDVVIGLGAKELNFLGTAGILTPRFILLLAYKGASSSVPL